MPFNGVNEAEIRLKDAAPLTEQEIRDLVEWMGVLSAGAIRRLDAESALQNLKAIRHFDESSGKIGFWGLALNIGLFVLTVVGVWIAIKSYDEANKTSESQARVLAQQQLTLEASRAALGSVIANVEKQTTLLEENLRTSESHLKLTQEQFRHEMERPDVEAILIYPQAPSIVIHNTSKTKAAREIFYEARFWNLSKPGAPAFELVSSLVGTVSAMSPESLAGPFRFQLRGSQGAEASLGQVDRLFGYVTLQCPDCLRLRLYWVYEEYGKTGSYCEGKWTEYDWFHLSENNINDVLDSFQKRKDLTPLARIYP